MLKLLGKRYEKTSPDQAIHTSDDPYKRLANGIILQAVRDYRVAKRALMDEDWERLLLGATGKMKKRILEARKAHENTIKEIGEFFKSDYFAILTNVNGEDLLQKLEQEARTREETET